MLSPFLQGIVASNRLSEKPRLSSVAVAQVYVTVFQPLRVDRGHLGLNFVRLPASVRGGGLYFSVSQ